MNVLLLSGVLKQSVTGISQGFVLFSTAVSIYMWGKKSSLLSEKKQLLWERYDLLFEINSLSKEVQDRIVVERAVDETVARSSFQLKKRGSVSYRNQIMPIPDAVADFNKQAT